MRSSSRSPSPLTLVAAGLAVFLLGGPGAAAAGEASGDDSPGNSFTIGSQAQQGGGYTASAGMDFAGSNATTWTLEAQHDRSASSIPKTSLTGLTTTSFTAGVRHDFRHSGFDLSLDAWQDPGVVHATEVLNTWRLGGDAFNVGMELEGRHSTFNPFRASTTVKLANGTLQPVNAIASCLLDNGGYGLRLAFAAGGWSGNLDGMKYVYASSDCQFDSPGLQALRKTKAAQFRQLAAALTQRFGRNAASKMSSRDSFLDYEVSAGLEYKGRAASYGVDLDHTIDQFESLAASTLTGNVDLDIGATSQLDLEAGVSKSATYGNLPFAGVSLTHSF